MVQQLVPVPIPSCTHTVYPARFPDPCHSLSVTIGIGASLTRHIPISQQHSENSLNHIIWDSVSTSSTPYILFNPAMWISMAITISLHRSASAHPNIPATFKGFIGSYYMGQCVYLQYILYIIQPCYVNQRGHQYQSASASAQSNIPARFNEFIGSYYMGQCVYLQYTLYIIHWFTEFGEHIWYDTLFCSLNCIIWHTVTALPEAIVDLVRGEGDVAGKPFPHALVLGKDAYTVAGNMSQSALSSLDEWKDVSLSTDFKE